MSRREYVTQDPLRMNAYYFGFTETGVRQVDEILSAVACAGKSYHHTEDWSDEGNEGVSYVDLIQEAADRAASSARGGEAEIVRLRAYPERVRREIERMMAEPSVSDLEAFRELLRRIEAKEEA